MTLRILASGVLYRDPEARVSATGKAYTVAKLRVDTSDGMVWCSLIAFAETGEKLAMLKAGASLSVSGRGRTSSRVTSRHFDQSNASRVFMSRSNRPYGLTCSHIRGVRAA
jgi:hypothetical protein